MQGQREPQGTETGDPVDTGKLAKCQQKFLDKCAKEQARNDCVTQAQSCGDIENEADACVDSISSPSAAFLE